jgi:hypothetical protein
MKRKNIRMRKPIGMRVMMVDDQNGDWSSFSKNTFGGAAFGSSGLRFSISFSSAMGPVASRHPPPLVWSAPRTR